MNDTPPDQATPHCNLCARPGDYGPLTPDDPHSGLCPDCLAAGRPGRDALEMAVIAVAGQHLTAAEQLDLATATPEELVYQVTCLARSLRSVLQLIATQPPAVEAGPTLHLCGHCRTTTDRPTVARTADTGSGPLHGIVVCPPCAAHLQGDHRDALR